MPGSGETTVKRPTIHGALAHPQGIPRGFLRLYVLHRIAARPAHGYDLLQEIESKTEGVWRPGAGSIYPILKELVNGGFIKTESHKKTGKQQHIYNITPEGRALLQRSSEIFMKTGQNWAAMRSILMELVDQQNDEIVGSIIGGWDGRRGWIYHLAVKPQYQRKRIGANLVQEVETRLLAKGAKKVNAQVYKWNERSSEFFKAIGYETQPDLIMIGKRLRK